MASAHKQCDICEGKYITKEAEFWCPQCHEGFCSECNKHHSISKLTKQHKVISTSDFQKLPEYISSIVNQCEEHDKLFTNYCSKHEGLYCPECIKENHKKCDSLLLIDDVIKHSKSSALLESIQENIRYLKDNYEKIFTEHDKNIEENQKERDEILAEIKNIRRNINEHLDKLEKVLTESINEAEESIQTDISQLKEGLTKRKQAVDQLENDINMSKKYASDLQMCLGIRNFQTKLGEEEQYLSSLLESGLIKTKRIKFDFNEQIRDLTTLKETLRTLTTEEKTIPLKRAEREKRAQIITRPQSTVKTSIHDINVALNSKRDLPIGTRSCNITGFAITSDGQIILADHSKATLLILTEDVNLVKEVDFPRGSYPTDVTLVDDKTISVSFGNNRLEMIDTSTCKTIQVIQTDNPCCGVTSDGENLIWYERFKGIQIKQKSSDTITTLVKDNSGYYWSYLTVHNDKIYQTHNDNHTVTCFTISGEKVWEFKDPSVIEYPRGITVDNDSNVYVATDGHKVVVLSPDGKTTRVLLTSNDGLSYPYGIYFDKIKNILIVTNNDGKMFLYNVSLVRN